jgi:hypothetical protein
MTLSRRQLLASTAALGLLAPFSRARRAHGQATSKGKALFFYIPDGLRAVHWHPTGSERSFTLAPMVTPLAAIQQHLVFVKGVDMYGGNFSHDGGMRKVLTAGGPVSLDVFLGQRLGQGTPHASLQLGVASNLDSGAPSMSFIDDGQEVKPDDDPLNAFERVFGAADPGEGDGPAALRRRRRSILDLVQADMTRVRGRLAGAERAKLDTHLDSFRELEQRVVAPPTQVCSPDAVDRRGFVNNPGDGYPRTYHRPQHFATVGDIQMDIAVAALSCRVTRVASITWSHPISNVQLAGSGTDFSNHGASHYGVPDTAAAQAFIKIKHWFLQRFVYLVEKLATTPDPDGGMLLDNTVVLLCSELGDSNFHDHQNMPFVLAGRAGGRIATGRLLDCSRSHNGENQPHSKLLVSIAHAVGVPLDGFGYTGHGTGPLPGLLT